LPCKHEALKSNPNIAKKERGMLKLKLKWWDKLPKGSETIEEHAEKFLTV
jgi:hypothetical protein